MLLSVGCGKNWLVRSASEVEQNVVSVERITHYANDLPAEAPRELPDNKPSAGWPGAGEVEFRWVKSCWCVYGGTHVMYSEYSMRYRPELDLVLKEISLTVVCVSNFSWFKWANLI